MYFIPGKDYEIFVLDQPVMATYCHEIPVMGNALEVSNPEKGIPEYVPIKMLKGCFRLFSGEIIPAKDICFYRSLESKKWCINPEVAIFFNKNGFLTLPQNECNVFEYKKRNHHFIRFQIKIINNIEFEYSVVWNDKIAGIYKKHSIKKYIIGIYNVEKTFAIEIFLEVGKELSEIMGNELILDKKFVMNEIIYAL